jgi:tetratricopeptide (TPR) repeat protein
MASSSVDQTKYQQMSEFFPKEYKLFLKDLTNEELDSLYYTFRKLENEIDQNSKYESLINILEQTVMVFSNPPSELVYLLGRTTFLSAQYDHLENHLFGNVSNNDYLKPFVARILANKNQFDQSTQMLDEILKRLNLETPSLVDIYAYCEAQFTLGFVNLNSRNMEGMVKVIEELETFTNRYIVKKTVTDEYQPNIALYEYLLKCIISVASGQPTELLSNVNLVETWIDRVNDPWMRGYFHNLAGIAYAQNQQMKLAEENMKMCMEYTDVVNDIRTFAVVGANLGTLLILGGRRQEGRKIIEEVIEPFVTLGNYQLAMTHMLSVSRQFLEEKDFDNSKSYLNWAEEILKKIELSEPATYSYFIQLYSNLNKLEKGKEMLDILEGIYNEKNDIYTQIWYNQSKAYYSFSTGNLSTAEEIVRETLELADQNKMYDLALELNSLLLQIIMKRYILEQKPELIHSALQALEDLLPLLETVNNVFLDTIMQIINGYLNLSLNNISEVENIVEEILETQFDELSEAFDEFSKFYRRYISIYEREDTKIDEDFINVSDKDTRALIRKNLMEEWFSMDHLAIFFVYESERLLKNLQFRQFTQGQLQAVDKIPLMILIVQTNGITVYTHKFKEGVEIDEVLISAMLMAMSSFSKEVFGSGLLKRIEQDNHILLIDPLNDENVLIMVVDDESYLIRKKFRKIGEEIRSLGIIDYLESGIYLSENDPQFQVLESIVFSVFDNSETNSNSSEQS